jgi:hypothetical protein
MKRATVEDIRKHEWFLEGAGCPTYLFPDRVTDTSIVDTDAIAEVSQKFGVEESEIHSALLSDDPHNALVIAYNLVIDNRRIESAKEKDKEKEDLKLFYSSAVGGGSSTPAPAEGLGHKPHPERIAPLRDKPVTPVEKTHRGAPIKRSKWHLGIRSQVCARQHPALPPLPPVQAARHHERGLPGHEAARLRVEGGQPLPCPGRSNQRPVCPCPTWSRCGGRTRPMRSM